MKVRLALWLIVTLGAVAAATGLGATDASACDQGYWNVPSGNGCQWYTSGEGHSEIEFCCGNYEYARSSWSTYNDMLFFETTYSGSWTESVVVSPSPQLYGFLTGGNKKIGCYNHNSGTKFVNCRRYNEPI